MRGTLIIASILVFMASSNGYAAEKSKALSLIESTRIMIEGAAAKVGGNKAAAADLDQARASLRKAEEVFEKGRALFGFGDVKPEAEQDIKHYAGMAELAVSLASSRIEKLRADGELESLDKQLVALKAKVKIFEDRKAELAKLRADAAKCQSAVKELEALKADKALLASQLEPLLAERGQADKLKGEKAELARKLEELKAENSRLTEQVEKAKGGAGKSPVVSPPVIEPVKENPPLKEPAPAKESVPHKESPAPKEPMPPTKEVPAPAAPEQTIKEVPAAIEPPASAPAEKK